MCYNELQYFKISFLKGLGVKGRVHYEERNFFDSKNKEIC